MSYVTIEHDSNHIVVVNTDQITYLRQDTYGTSVHFTSGEHIICPLDLDVVMERLVGTDDGKGSDAGALHHAL